MPFTASDVAVMMGLVKVARLKNNPTHEDSWVDLAGYAACGSEVSGDNQNRSVLDMLAGLQRNENMINTVKDNK